MFYICVIIHLYGLSRNLLSFVLGGFAIYYNKYRKNGRSLTGNRRFSLTMGFCHRGLLSYNLINIIKTGGLTGVGFS